MIIRAIVVKNASVTGTSCACTGAGQGTVVDLGGRACDVALYGGVQILSSTAGGLKAWIQGNSSSGYTALNTGTDLVAFTSRGCRDGQLQRIPWNCASATSTDRRYYRAAFTQTCAQSNLWIAALDVDTVRT